MAAAARPACVAARPGHPRGLRPRTGCRANDRVVTVSDRGMKGCVSEATMFAIGVGAGEALRVNGFLTAPGAFALGIGDHQWGAGRGLSALRHNGQSSGVRGRSGRGAGSVAGWGASRGSGPTGGAGRGKSGPHPESARVQNEELTRHPRGQEMGGEDAGVMLGHQASWNYQPRRRARSRRVSRLRIAAVLGRPGLLQRIQPLFNHPDFHTLEIRQTQRHDGAGALGAVGLSQCVLGRHV